ncbi:uncharacterized protein LOC111245267 [Varroa destructor]|uniref:Uncharacterized protein n=1 Tax=Varroa destructor TaxID=109461 RepID=A0A7M7MB49_VARDE|nr:uncharacterized protein LOC111245267 [Varroa destructor]
MRLKQVLQISFCSFSAFLQQYSEQYETKLNGAWFYGVVCVPLGKTISCGWQWQQRRRQRRSGGKRVVSDRQKIVRRNKTTQTDGQTNREVCRFSGLLSSSSFPPTGTAIIISDAITRGLLGHGGDVGPADGEGLLDEAAPTRVTRSQTLLWCTRSSSNNSTLIVAGELPKGERKHVTPPTGRARLQLLPLFCGYPVNMFAALTQPPCLCYCEERDETRCQRCLAPSFPLFRVPEGRQQTRKKLASLVASKRKRRASERNSRERAHKQAILDPTMQQLSVWWRCSASTLIETLSRSETEREDGAESNEVRSH